MTQVFHLLPEIHARETGGCKKCRGSGRHGKSKVTIPADQVLDMRRRHEILRQSMQQVINAYPDYHPSYIRRVLAYEVRANLRVK